MADDVGVLVAKVVADTEQFRADMLKVSNQVASNTAKMNGALAKLQESSGSLSKQLENMTGILAKVGIAFGLVEIVKFAKDTLEAAANLQHLSERLNISVEALSDLQYVSKITDVSFDSLTRSMSFMVKTIGEAERGATAAKEVFGELGLNFQVLSKLPVNEQFIAVADALSRVQNESERSALAVKVFSKSGQEMLQIVNAGPEALRAMMQEAHDLGGTTTEMAKASADAKDAMDRLGFAAQSLANNSLPTLAHALEVVATGWNHILFNASPFPFQAQIDTLITRIHVMNEQFNSSGGMTDDWKQKFLADMDAAIKKLAELKTAQERAMGLGSGGVGAGAKGPNGLNVDPTKAAGKQGPQFDPLQDGNALGEYYGQLALQEETIAAKKNEALLSMEQQIQKDINASREETLQNDIARTVAGYNAEREYAHRRRDLALETSSSIESAAESLMQVSQGHNKKMFEISKKVALASAIVNTAQGVTKALAEIPPPASFAVAAAIAAAGLLQVQRIRGTSYESAGGGAASVPNSGALSALNSSSSTAASSDLRKNTQKVVTIQFMGDVYGWDDYTTKKIIPAIRDAVDDNDVIIIGGNSRQASLLGAGG